MIVKVNPSIISGTIKAPASKSSMQRACAMALLANGKTTILNAGKSNDDLAALDIIQKLGATIEIANDELNIGSSDFKNKSAEINCGESGLGIRMFAPIVALSSAQITINGTGSLLKRPMNFFDEIFPQLGVNFYSNNGHLPLTIKGPLQPADIIIDGSLSSQFLTGLLIAFANAATKPVTITVINLKSKPYIDLTLQMMNQFGYKVENDNYQKFLIQPHRKNQAHQTIIIEGDWSGAAFLLVAAAIAGSITITGLDIFSTQADKAILKALMDCGTNISIEEKQISINTALGKNGKPFQFDATDCPDLFPPLVALAACCNGTSVLTGVKRLLHKESNRAITLQQEFAKMGIKITLQEDLMLVEGGCEITAATFNSHHDHRIAMACAVAALKANGPSFIEDAEAVNKSYPNFFDDLKLLHAAVSLI
ncbi:MAG TPA: 3-phosphoshikimate 1-carboxyvinyltransferase [Ferruginibacter sp.]|nr:3-phosphoshikimate 1-carboxyvinyltransferase [Ferruginibacter sp.]